jgi:hypothetical protein
MTKRVFVGDFANEEDLLGAARAARGHGLRIADAFAPHPVHGLDQIMGLRPSRLPWLCFLYGLIGAVFAFTTQPWAMARSWPINVGGKPWSSLPAYVPVTFEVMVLLAGLGLVATFLLRSKLLPGRQARPLYSGVTDATFVLVLEHPVSRDDEQTARQVFLDFHAVRVAEQ